MSHYFLSVVLWLYSYWSSYESPMRWKFPVKIVFLHALSIILEERKRLSVCAVIRMQDAKTAVNLFKWCNSWIEKHKNINRQRNVVQWRCTLERKTCVLVIPPNKNWDICVFKDFHFFLWFILILLVCVCISVYEFQHSCGCHRSQKKETETVEFPTVLVY